MTKGNLAELPYEGLVKRICGSQWRQLPDRERDGAIGVAIVKSVLDGVSPDMNEISTHLGVDRDALLRAFRGLSLNGVFRGDVIRKDKGLRKDDLHAWCYYAGYASGAVGIGS